MTFSLGIRFKLFLLHFLVIFAAIVSMSYKSYLSQWELSQKQIIQHRSDVSKRFLNPVSMATSGSNYANLQLPVFKNELSNLPTLLYMHVNGKSDLGTPYAVAYLKKFHKIWRVYYPDSFEENLLDKIKKLKNYQKNSKGDLKKIDYLLDRAKDELEQFHQNIALEKKAQKEYEDLLSGNTNLINTHNWTLNITFPTQNKNGGEIIFVFDISELKSIRDNLLNHMIIEMIVATIIFIPILWLIGTWIIKPTEKLTNYMSKDLKDIDPNKIPAVNQDDEIGQLAKKLKMMVIMTQKDIKSIEELSITDSLTGLYNRRFFDEIKDSLINNVSRNNAVLSYIYLDIDNFKKYNDTYGHNKGDITLQDVASIIKSCVNRNNDYCFRLGGEEFLVITITNSIDDAIKIAESIRNTVYNEQIEHKENEKYGYVTVSIGICSKHFDDKPHHIDSDAFLKNSDEQLYKAKNSGRNRVSSITL